MYNRLVAILLLLQIVLVTGAANSVKLSWIGKVPSAASPVSFGVPFEKSAVSVTRNFVLTDTDGNEYPLQQWPMAYWPDGSVKWMGFASVVNPSTAFFLTKSAVKISSGYIQVETLADKVIVRNGKYSCEVHKTGKSFLQIKSNDLHQLLQSAYLECAVEKHPEVNLTSIESYKSCIDSVIVEQSGPVRAVLKITGTYQNKSNIRILPFTVRLYFFYQSEQIKMVHSFIYNLNEKTDFLKSIGVVFDVPLESQPHNRHVRFSGANGLWSETVKPLSGRYPFVYKGDNSLPQKQFDGLALPEILPDDSLAYAYFSNFPNWNDFKLVQINPNGFSILKRTNDASAWVHADDGTRSSGFAMLGDNKGGMAVALRDFWQSYPASLEVNNANSSLAQMKLWFWSPDAAAMDMRHYDTIAHDLNATYEDVQPGLSTPYGIARTNELMLFPFTELPTKQKCVTFAGLNQQPPVLLPEPVYLQSVNAFGKWSLPDRSTPLKSSIENRLDSLIDYYKKSIDQRHWYGFWNYGDVMHTYDPVRHVWKYDVGGFAWDNTELAPNNWLWYSFLRTGRADIFRMAEAMTRHTSEVDAYHLGEMKGLGTRHNVSHWGCGSKEARIGQAMWKRFYYYLTTDERSGDLMREALDVEKSLVKFEPLRIAQPREKFPYNGPMRLRWGPDWLALAANWMTEWERTGNTVYRDKIMVGLKSLSQLPDNLFTGPNGLSYDPETNKLWYDGPKGRTNNNHLATIMGGFEFLSEMFDMIDYKPFKTTFIDYCKYYSLDKSAPGRTEKTKSWGDFNFRTPRLTAFAANELNDDDMALRAWRELLADRNALKTDDLSINPLFGNKTVSGVNSLNTVIENERVSTNGAAQWSLNALYMLRLIGDKMPQQQQDKLAFDTLLRKTGKVLFADDFKSSWQKKWFLDGKLAILKNTSEGLMFKAGNVNTVDSGHSVLWTWQKMKGNIRIDFDFVKLDTETRFVNIVYLFANGSGHDKYDTDIQKWQELRTIPAMRWYFDHMNAYHISFAAYENDNIYENNDYIRARRYMPETKNGLKNTEILPEYARTGFFRTGNQCHITIIRYNEDIWMRVSDANHSEIYKWNTSSFPYIHEGRIGLRVMAGRASLFSDFRITEIN